jgi:hypothetical protein
MWSYWGAFECFHEGWYSHSLWANLGLGFIQYWCWPIAFAGLAALGIWKPKVGGAMFVAIGLLINGWLFGFQNSVALVFLLAPSLLLGALFAFGTVPRPRLSIALVIGVPALIIVCITIPLAIKVSRRLTAIRNVPLVWANGSETLVWAPPGPGWPLSGVDYSKAKEICAHLSLDGRSISLTELNLWRLPTVEEAERALNRHGHPAGCTYSGKPGFQPCRIEPDKEAPLWNTFSPVIYWWTGTDDESDHNLRIAYNGYVLPVRKAGSGYTAFRAVRVAGREEVRIAN